MLDLSIFVGYYAVVALEFFHNLPAKYAAVAMTITPSEPPKAIAMIELCQNIDKFRNEMAEKGLQPT